MHSGGLCPGHSAINCPLRSTTSARTGTGGIPYANRTTSPALVQLPSSSRRRLILSTASCWFVCLFTNLCPFGLSQLGDSGHRRRPAYGKMQKAKPRTERTTHGRVPCCKSQFANRAEIRGTSATKGRNSTHIARSLFPHEEYVDALKPKPLPAPDACADAPQDSRRIRTTQETK